MSWSIVGNGSALSIHANERGLTSLSGTALSHEPRPTGGDVNPDFYSEMSMIECVWSILSSAEIDEELSLYSDELLKIVREEPNISHGVINYFETEPSIGITIVFPDEHIQEIVNLFREVLVNKDLQYVIGIKFTGLGKEGENPKATTINAFRAGKGRIFSGANFTIMNGSST